MENVVDIVKFSHGFLGRYALGRLVGMNYQARLGIMAAGAYGLPQFRMRVFMWGALPGESNTVAYDEGHGTRVKKALFLGDAISDLPPV
nr:DNA (cytosine-5)-methyltransferase CMT3-like [Ipomoea batatas]